MDAASGAPAKSVRLQMKYVLFTIILGISVIVNAEIPEWMKNQPIVDDYLRGSTKQFGGNDLERIRSYSQLLSEEITEYIDPYHSKEIGAKRHTFKFEGVVVQGFFIPGKRFYLEYIEVTTPTYNFIGGIGVGSKESELKAYFKSNGTSKGNTIHFRGESENVVFTIKGGVVTKVQLYGYTG